MTAAPTAAPPGRRRHRLSGATTVMIAVGTLLAGVGAPNKRLGYLAIQEVAWRNPEHTEFSEVTFHWETWPA